MVPRGLQIDSDHARPLKRLVEARYEGILIGFARVSMLSHRTSGCAPLFERFTEKLAAIVRPNDLR